MIKLSQIESCKAVFEVILNMIPGGVIFGIVEGNTIAWRDCSENLANLDILQVGYQLDSSSVTMNAIRDRKTYEQKVPRNVYGTRLHIVSIPIIDDEGNAYGALSIAMPILHPVANSFKDFSPILSEMFAEGAFLYMTDLKKIAYRQPSQKFDVPEFVVDRELQEGDVAYKVIKTKQPAIVELDASRFGIPVSVANFPLFDVQNKEDVVATLGIIMPKETAATLREMSTSMENGLTNISSAIQELAASATEIHTNEQSLNKSVNEIISISDEINNVSIFIKEIADETKMLGLNAAIEAARAGEAGRGFGVVAEEIRKLSDQSKSTVPKINKLTEEIKIKVNEASNKSKSSLDASQDQAAASEEITSSVEEITSMSVELAKIAMHL